MDRPWMILSLTGLLVVPVLAAAPVAAEGPCTVADPELARGVIAEYWWDGTAGRDVEVDTTVTIPDWSGPGRCEGHTVTGTFVILLDRCYHYSEIYFEGDEGHTVCEAVGPGSDAL